MAATIAFFVGLFIGGAFGFLCAALAVAVGRGENRGDDDA